MFNHYTGWVFAAENSTGTLLDNNETPKPFGICPVLYIVSSTIILSTELLLAVELIRTIC